MSKVTVGGTLECQDGKADEMETAMAAFLPLASGPPQMSTTTPIAAIGLDI